MAGESKFQKNLVKELRVIFPDCIVIKNDPTYMQGIPDWLVLWKDHWAMLEAKADENAPFQPNQPYWLDVFGEMSFASVIYPENKDEVLQALAEEWGVRYGL